MSSEELAQRAADHVREVVAEAERRAAEIVREAEAEAKRIREEAHRQAAELREANPRLAQPAPPEPPAPAPPSEPGGDDSAARLVAMKLALDGGDRDRIASELEAKFGAGDRSALIDDVLARAGRS